MHSKKVPKPEPGGKLAKLENDLLLTECLCSPAINTLKPWVGIQSQDLREVMNIKE